jgi:DNA-binding PadR family transcriptional regulator
MRSWDCSRTASATATTSRRRWRSASAAATYNSGQVHQALGILESRGWAVSRESAVLNRTRRQFCITAAGRAEFFAWLEQPITIARPQRDEMVVKMIYLADHDPERLVTILEERQREYVRRLGPRPAGDTRPGKGDDTAVVLRSLARDAFRFREEGELRWIEHCLSQMRKMLPRHAHGRAEPGARARR